MKRPNPASVRSDEYEHNGVKFLLSVQPTMKGFVAWWTCPECGQIGLRFTDVSFSDSQRKAQESFSAHVCDSAHL